MKSHVTFNADQQRIVFSGVLDLSDIAALEFTEYEQIILAEPAETAVHLFQVLETLWRAHQRCYGAIKPDAS